MDDEYISAEEAAELLGVSRTTLYAYVSRKGLRSQQLPGTRAHRYWRADIERIRTRKRRPPAVVGDLRRDSEITLLTERGPYYRGRSAAELAQSASLEAVAALLWDVDEREVFTAEVPRSGKMFAELDAVVAGEPGGDRAVAHFPFLEPANPRSYDLTPGGMARTGADVVRWLAAIMLRRPCASTDPVHLQFGQALDLTDELTDLVRRLLVLAADHGFEQSTYAVRAVASAGVTPWRAVATGLIVTAGRRSKVGHSDALRRFVAEIVGSADPEDPVVRRLRDGETLPGFASEVYDGGDPRAEALFAYCDEALGEDEGYTRLRRALDLAFELKGIRPSFAMAASFVATKLGSRRPALGPALSPMESPFLVARSVGWIAHAIEQFKSGEAEHRELLYRGPLPAPV